MFLTNRLTNSATCHESRRSAGVGIEIRAHSITPPGGYGMARCRLQTLVCFIDGGLDAHRHHNEILRPVSQLCHLSTAIVWCCQMIIHHCYNVTSMWPQLLKISQFNIPSTSSFACGWDELHQMQLDQIHTWQLVLKVQNFSPHSRPNSPQSQVPDSNLFSQRFMLPY